jgi:hypothetical protein
MFSHVTSECEKKKLMMRKKESFQEEIYGKGLCENFITAMIKREGESIMLNAISVEKKN